MKTLILILGITSITAFADDWILLNGRKYEGVTVTNQDATTVTISHASGIARLIWSDISPELRASLGFDQAKYDKALADEKERRVIAEKAAQDLAKAVRIKVTIDQVFDSGFTTRPIPAVRHVPVPLSSSGSVGGSVAEYKRANPQKKGDSKPKGPVRPQNSASGSFYLTDHPSQDKLTSGKIIDVDAVESGVYIDPDDDGHRIKKYRILRVYSASD